ncbi:MAG: hypothetical protein AB1552_00870 [Nitrospirota bacterium]
METIVKKDQLRDFIRERLKNEQPFCTLPWMKMWIEDGTKIRNCCYQVDSVGDLSVQTFQEIWNGRVQQEVRAYILKGKFHPICKCVEKVGSLPVHPEPESIVHANNLEVSTEAPPEITLSRLLFCSRQFSLFLKMRAKLRDMFKK